jgi:hypothetical protein
MTTPPPVPHKLTIGTRVTNAKGWHGTITTRPKRWRWKPPPDGNPIVYVRWEERENPTASDKKTRQAFEREPVLSARPETLTVITP